MKKKGGKRAGAGRPKGSKSRVSLYDYWGEEEIKEYFDFLRDNYKEDSRLMVFVGEQLMGKATQAITGAEGGPLVIEISEHIQKKNASHSGSNRDS